MLGPQAAPKPLNWPAGSCERPTAELELAVWQVVTDGGRRPDLTCGNAFAGYLVTPRSVQTPMDAFDVIAGQVVNAKAEVLLVNMEWMSGPGKPGWTFARAVRDLLARVRANPAAYPQGMSVRVVLGGFPDTARSDGASQPLALLRDLQSLGVPLRDDSVGWQVSIANYRYFPHSHVKMQVIDGRDLGVDGFNFTDWHLPVSQPGGRDLHDLGLRMGGPVAQDGVAVFDDLWRHSQQLQCPDSTLAACSLGTPQVISHPLYAREAVKTGTSRAFMLYRRSAGVDDADRAHLALMGAAKHTLDLMQADFSPGLDCWYGYLNPEPCGPKAWPVYMNAVLNATKRGVKVRLLLVNYGFGAAANRSGVTLIRRELLRLGMADRFEARYVNFYMHTKALSADGQMVVVGSMNFHFSSWGNLGLAEASLATSDPEAVAEQEAHFNDVWANSSVRVPDEWWFRNITPGMVN